MSSPSQTSEAALPATRKRSLLVRHGDYQRLWSAATISLFGTQISQVAIPFIAAVLLGAEAFQVALLGTVEFLPFLLFTLPAGAWVDRLPRRLILVAADLGRAVSLLELPSTSCRSRSPGTWASYRSASSTSWASSMGSSTVPRGSLGRRVR